MSQEVNYQIIEDIVLNYAKVRALELSGSMKLAHYTSAENALNIINGETVWLRNSAVMNDHSEIEYGRAIVGKALETPDFVGRLMQILDHFDPEIGPGVLSHFRSQIMQAREKIFMLSLSEINRDDKLGRLSMWRAYGGRVSGVALIINPEVIFFGPDELHAFTSPILYGGVENFLEQFRDVIDGLERKMHILQGMPASYIANYISWALDVATLSIKHPGFEEEREWRVIYRPFDYSSAFMEGKVKSINGTPQLIYQLPLKNLNGMNMPHFNLNNLLHRVIVGPSMYPETTRQALVEALQSKGVSDPERRIVVSDIPLRQTG